MQPKVRRYIDVNGQRRELRLLREAVVIIAWHKQLPESTCSTWRVENGSIVQIPDDAWRNHGRKWKGPVHL